MSDRVFGKDAKANRDETRVAVEAWFANPKNLETPKFQIEIWREVANAGLSASKLSVRSAIHWMIREGKLNPAIGVREYGKGGPGKRLFYLKPSMAAAGAT